LRIEITSDAVTSGFAEIASAAIPATKGVALEVPPNWWVTPVGVPVVVVTGFGTFSMPLVKAVAILQKPFSAEELLAALLLAA